MSYREIKRLEAEVRRLTEERDRLLVEVEKRRVPEGSVPIAFWNLAEFKNDRARLKKSLNDLVAVRSEFNQFKARCTCQK